MLYSRPVPHKQAHQQDPVTSTKFHHTCLVLVITGRLPYSTKWGGPTLGLVSLILYSRPVPHQQVHQPDPVTSTTSCLSKISHLCPFSPLPRLGHHWPPSLLYKMGGPTLVCTVGLSHTSRHTSKTHSQHVTTTKFHHILPIKDTSPPSTFALSAPCLGLVTTGHLPYSTKWDGPTLGLVSLILYSRPVSHHQTHQQDPVTTTKFHHILPLTPSTIAL